MPTEQEPPAPSNEPDRLTRIRELLDAPSEPDSGTKGHGLWLLLSASLFIGVESFRSRPAEVALLLLVLLIHEGGHFMAMRALGFRDARILFIPFLGAVTAGKPAGPDAYRGALVSLAGPVPGILIGLALALAANAYGSAGLREAGWLFLSLNALNLLPLGGLDGSRFAEKAFAGSPVREAGCRLATGVVAAGLCIFGLGSYFIGAWFGFGAYLELSRGLPRARAAARLRERLDGEALAAESFPAEHVEWMAGEVDRYVSAQVKASPEIVSGELLAIWSRLRESPMSPRRRYSLLAGYAGAFALVAVFVFVGRAYRPARWGGTLEAADFDRVMKDGKIDAVEMEELIKSGKIAPLEPEPVSGK